MEVVNGKTFGWIGAEYIGRGRKGLKHSVLSNRFVIGRDGDRDEVVAKYRAWLWLEVKAKGEVWDELVRLAERRKAGEDIVLACWCAPLPCHGDVIVRCIEWMIREGHV